jgi:malonyl-CoA O-methyltransferase
MANILDLPLLNIQQNSTDILYSNLALSYYSDLMSILNIWKNILKPDGLIIFSMFGAGTAKEIIQDTNNIIPLMDMHNVGDILLKQGFINPVIHTQRFDLDYSTSNIQGILADLHAFGLLFRLPKNQKITDNICNNLHEFKRYANNIKKISIEIIYAHAWYLNTNTNTLNNLNNSSIIQIDKLYQKIK